MSTNSRQAVESRVAKVTVATAFSTVLSIGMQLVSVPVCLHFWGKDTYGTWLALFAAFTLIRTIDSGYIGYVTNKVNVLYHRNEEELRQTLASAIYGIGAVAVLQCFILIALSILTISGLLSYETSRQNLEYIFALFILCLTWLLSGSYVGIVHGLLVPTGLMYQAAWWSMCLQFSQFLALLAAAMLRLDILEASLMFALIQIIIYGASALYIKVNLPQYYPWWRAPNRKRGLKDLMGSIPLTLSTASQHGGNSALVMLVSVFCGTAAVPAFTTARTIGNLWSTLTNVLTYPLLPDIVRYYEKGFRDKLTSVQQIHWLVMGSIINLGVLCSYPFLEPAYVLWTQNDVPLQKPLLNMILAAATVIAFSSLLTTLFTGINHARFFLVSAGLRGGGLLLLGLILLSVFGLTGLGVSILLTETGIAIMAVIFLRKELMPIGNKHIDFYGLLPFVSSACVVSYLIGECFTPFRLGPGYWIALSGVTLCTILQWRGLDTDLKLRIRGLLSVTAPAKLVAKYDVSPNS